MTDVARAHQGQNDVVVLLALVLVHRRDLVRSADERVGGTALLDHVRQQVLLAVVRRENADALGRIAKQAHVHEQRDAVLGFAQILQNSGEQLLT